MVGTPWSCIDSGWIALARDSAPCWENSAALPAMAMGAPRHQGASGARTTSAWPLTVRGMVPGRANAKALDTLNLRVW